MYLHVNVIVEGNPSEAEDEHLPGIYSHIVFLTRPVDPSEPTEGEAGAIASAVLDSFHEHQGIECLDDFEIRVQIDDGIVITEAADSKLHTPDLVKDVEHEGKSSRLPPPRMDQK